ncbi:DNA cytosine methyltransferase [Polymorphospora rubra]|uniref:DNA cytosine methyltransferase n=1 Tax=Polymorphospora rubra TaxID=338584 RepID=UPI0034001EC7
MNVLSLFAGIGGLELGLERAGMTVVGQVEIDPFCRRVLAAHWPEVPRHDDVRTAVPWWRSRPRPAVHVVAGGFPCQPVSSAGRRLAQADPRWLWNPMAGIIADLRPEWVVAENVPGLRTRGLATVLADLARLGYAARAGYISACEMGAPHPRKRLFVLAHPESRGRCPWRPQPGRTGQADSSGVATQSPRRHRWDAEPDVGRMAHGVPAGVDRRRALGNAVVPDVAEHIGRLITSGTASATARRAA